MTHPGTNETELRELAGNPQAFDEKEAALYADVIRLEQWREGAWDRLHIAAGDRKEWVGRRHLWKATGAEVIRDVKYRADHGNQRIVRLSATPLELLNRANELEQQIAQAMIQIEAMERVYREIRWPRFYPCMNTDGHIHSSFRGCPSVRATTDMRWYPQLSGKTVEEAVQDLGPHLCSICFPLVRPEWQLSKKDLRPAGCGGSGYAPREGTLSRPGRRRYGKCSKCEYHGQLTPNGLVRKHESKPAEEG